MTQASVKLLFDGPDLRMEPFVPVRPTLLTWTLNVLLVEDDPADSHLILDVLKRNQHVSAVSWYSRPAQALAELATGRLEPDLVLLDIHMPSLNGFVFLDALRELPRGRQTPVVFLTTSALERDVAEARRRMINGYVVKPDSYRELQFRLDTVIHTATQTWRH